jgi:hypothetical protein
VSALHWDAEKAAANAAQAAGEATTMSTPMALRGDAAGRNTSGAAPVTFAAAGNEITRERATLAVRDVLALQGSVALERVVVAVTLQDPALAAVVEGQARQRQEAQPTACTAEEEQQHPPAQRFVPQSALVAQASPGELRRQAPKGGVQTAQPRVFAVALQQ